MAQALPNEQARLRAMDVHASVLRLQVVVVDWIASNTEQKPQDALPLLFVSEHTSDC